MVKKLSVQQVILDRKAGFSQPGARDDSARVGLVIEGGGMRGVVSGAMSAALENLELSDCFDAVYGASAGAMAAAYFLARSARAGATIYYEHINSKHFVNPWRLLTSKPVLDLDFLVYDVFKNRVPLDCRKVIDSPCELHIVVTEVQSGQKRVFNTFASEAELLISLKASASNPIISGPPVQIEGAGYWDAILSESVPVKTAIEDGCTHVVVLRSRPKNETRSRMGIVEQFLAHRIIRTASEAAYQAYASKLDSYIAELEFVSSLGEICLTIAPTDGTKVSHTASDRVVLLGAAVDGYQNALAAFESKGCTVSPMIGHY